MIDYSFEDYLAFLKSSPSPDIRRNAAWQLGRLHNPVAIDALLIALHDADEGVRLRVVEALGAYRDTRILPALLALLGDSSADVRAMVAQSLGALGDITANEALLPYLQDNHEGVRTAVAKALGRVGQLNAIVPLVNCLIEDEMSSVRYEARTSLSVLAQSNAEAVQKALLAGLSRHEQHAGIAIDLIESLVLCGGRGALPDLMRYADVAPPDVQATLTWAIERLQR